MKQYTKKIVPVTIYLVMILLVGCEPPEPTPPAPPTITSSIYGVRVEGAETGEVIEGAEVTIEVGGERIDAFTDSYGFALIPLQESHLGRSGVLRVQKEGYKTKTENLTLIQILPEVVKLEREEVESTQIPVIDSPPCKLAPVISGPEQDNFTPGQEIMLVANVEEGGKNLDYNWSAKYEAAISDPTARIIIYTIPEEFDDDDLISLTVTSDDCDTGHFTFPLPIMSCAKPQLQIISPVEGTEIVSGEMITINAQISPEMFDVAWQVVLGEEAEPGEITGHSPSATFMVPEKPGPVTIMALTENECQFEASTDIDLSILSPTPTPIPPTSTPTFSAPTITRLELLPGGQLVVCWSWDGFLGDKNYAIRFWRLDDLDPNSRHSITWTQDTCFDGLTINNSRFPEGNYYLNIAVMEGPSDGNHWAIVESEPYLVSIPNIQPIDVPPPP